MYNIVLITVKFFLHCKIIIYNMQNYTKSCTNIEHVTACVTLLFQNKYYNAVELYFSNK
jgi:hypothetical protein